MGTNGSVVNVSTGLRLDVAGNGTADNISIGLWTCHGADNQKWLRQKVLTPAVDGYPWPAPTNRRCHASKVHRPVVLGRRAGLGFQYSIHVGAALLSEADQQLDSYKLRAYF